MVKLWIGMLCTVLLLAPGNGEELLAQGEPIVFAEQDFCPVQEYADLPDGYQTAVFSAEKDFGEGRTVRASALVKCYARGSFFSFEEVLATWTEKTGPGEYGFQEAYSHASISKDRQSLKIQARGVVETGGPDYTTASSGWGALLDALFGRKSQPLEREIASWGKTWRKTR